MTTYEDMDKKRCPLKMLEEIKGISYQFESHDYVYKYVHDAKKDTTHMSRKYMSLIPHIWKISRTLLASLNNMVQQFVLILF